MSSTKTHDGRSKVGPGGQPGNTTRVRAKVEQSQLQIVVEMGREVPLQSSLDVPIAALNYTPTSGSWSLVLLFYDDFPHLRLCKSSVMPKELLNVIPLAALRKTLRL